MGGRIEVYRNPSTGEGLLIYYSDIDHVAAGTNRFFGFSWWDPVNPTPHDEPLIPAAGFGMWKFQFPDPLPIGEYKFGVGEWVDESPSPEKLLDVTYYTVHSDAIPNSDNAPTIEANFSTGASISTSWQGVIVIQETVVDTPEEIQDTVEAPAGDGIISSIGEFIGGAISGVGGAFMPDITIQPISPEFEQDVSGDFLPGIPLTTTAVLLVGGAILLLGIAKFS